MGKELSTVFCHAKAVPSNHNECPLMYAGHVERGTVQVVCHLPTIRPERWLQSQGRAFLVGRRVFGFEGLVMNMDILRVIVAPLIC